MKSKGKSISLDVQEESEKLKLTCAVKSGKISF